MSQDYPLVAAQTAVQTPAGARSLRRGRGRRRLHGADRIIVILMVTIPTLLVVGLVWLPAIATVLLSFTSWNGIGGLSTIKWIGTTNYENVFTN